MFIQRDVVNVSLNPRDIPDEIVLAGQPQASGRILSVSEDSCCARVTRRMTTGAVKMSGVNPNTSDLMYVLEGGAEPHVAGEDPTVVKAGDWAECPRSDFELHVPDVLHKISVLYDPNSLSMEPE